MKRPSVELLVSAYVQGIFPMAHSDEGGEVYWYAPDPRAIMPLDDRFHVSRRLRQTVRKGLFEVRLSSDFEAVIRACAEPRPEADQLTTWLSEDLIASYLDLHRIGLAHSVECWRDGELVGGLYGVSIGGFFAGESMFHRVRDASKVALVHLVEHMRQRAMTLLDIQFMTDHLARFGAYEIPRPDYEGLLHHAVHLPVSFLR